MSKRSLLLLLTMTFLGTFNAHASLVTWNLEGTRFNDGGVATGFFTLTDTPSVALSDFDIKVSGGSWPSFEYTPASAGPQALFSNAIVLQQPGGRTLGLYIAPHQLWN